MLRIGYIPFYLSALQIPPPVLSVVNTNVIAGVPVNIAKTLAIVTPSLSLNSDVTVPLPVDGFVSHVQVPLADTDETAAANSGTPDDMDLLPASLSGDG